MNEADLVNVFVFSQCYGSEVLDVSTCALLARKRVYMRGAAYSGADEVFQTSHWPDTQHDKEKRVIGYLLFSERNGYLFAAFVVKRIET